MVVVVVVVVRRRKGGLGAAEPVVSSAHRRGCCCRRRRHVVVVVVAAQPIRVVCATGGHRHRLFAVVVAGSARLRHAMLLIVETWIDVVQLAIGGGGDDWRRLVATCVGGGYHRKVLRVLISLVECHCGIGVGRVVIIAARSAVVDVVGELRRGRRRRVGRRRRAHGRVRGFLGHVATTATTVASVQIAATVHERGIHKRLMMMLLLLLLTLLIDKVVAGGIGSGTVTRAVVAAERTLARRPMPAAAWRRGRRWHVEQHRCC